MYKYLAYAAYGWLATTGVLHFIVDVMSQYLHGKREPSLETSLYYGLNSAFSLGQLAFGVLGLMFVWRAMGPQVEAPVFVLSILAGLGWLVITFLFMEYWEPKLMVGIFCILILGAYVTH
ncbi:putative membrane protein [Alloalcanivorax dieselolei B5]|uniref:Putative membrane protein n=1 Tax=Alcanivorax dieselolei (strain DSM 16502 / CGMCC 1.3690 / MCCC 1A00001 / B-5) TaxID=930169 RepID=K0CH30_ALCDB|nr:hypothetical protein [Alloalcanivorax dieselolei]AFT71057.1 putative membrane protein [Alloalcanivorax dieselolei B5]